MYNIVILDSQSLGENFEISEFDQLGQVTQYERTLPEDVEERIKGQNIIITNKVVLNESNLKNAHELKFIGVLATGTNNVDLAYCKNNNIAVTNVAGYSTNSVAQHTFAMLFYVLENLAYYDNYVKSGEYAKSNNFNHVSKQYSELEGKTWGIIGLGTIGKRVAGIAEAFSCRVIYYSASGVNDYPLYEKVGLDELLKQSDIISIHSPLTELTKGLIGKKELMQMKDSAILLNLGRGGIVIEEDLAVALENNIIGAAALDVLQNEPINEDNPLLRIKDSGKLLITPHIAWGSIESRRRVIAETVFNIKAFEQNIMRNRVEIFG